MAPDGHVASAYGPGSSAVRPSCPQRCQIKRGSSPELGDDSTELAPGREPELGEHLAQVVLDRPGADEQLAADLRVCPARRSQPGDLGFLRREVGLRWSRCARGQSHPSPAARAGRARRTPRRPCHGTCRGRRRSCSRASSRRFSRRSHSPYTRWARARWTTIRLRSEPLDRLEVERARPRRRTASRARERASMPSAQSVPAGSVRPSRSGSASAAIVRRASAHGRLDELHEGETADAELIVLARGSGAGQRLVVPAEPVVQDSRHVAGLADRPSLAPRVAFATANREMLVARWPHHRATQGACPRRTPTARSRSRRRSSSDSSIRAAAAVNSPAVT